MTMLSVVVMLGLYMPWIVKATVLPAANWVGKAFVIWISRPLTAHATPASMFVTGEHMMFASTSDTAGTVTNTLPPAGMMFVVVNLKLYVALAPADVVFWDVISWPVNTAGSSVVRSISLATAVNVFTRFELSSSTSSETRLMDSRLNEFFNVNIIN